jgi:integrase
MGGQRISKKLVDSLRPAAKEFIIWDSALRGFGVRVRPSGAMSYVVVYRAGAGRKAPVRKVTLGAVGKITPDIARALAEKALGAIAHGRDPAAERARDRESMTVEELVEAFVADHAESKLKPTSARRYRDLLRRFVVPELGTAKADRLTRAAVAELHRKMKRRPVSANRMLGAVSSAYSFAQRRGFVPEGYNPAARIEKYPEHKRERFLTAAELGRIGSALREAETAGLPWLIDETKPNAKHIPKQAKSQRTKFGPFVTAAVPLLLFTGCRLREILHLRWDYFDAERGLLFLPDTKTGRRAVVLNAPALEVLASLPRVGPYVIPAGDPKRPRHDLKRLWIAVCRRAELKGVRLHDLRHTYASVGAAGGMGLPVIGKLLGHTQSATTQRYAHLDNDPLRRASETIGAQLSAALGGDGHREADVVPLQRPGGRA